MNQFYNYNQGGNPFGNQSLKDILKNQFKHGGFLWQIIYINVFVYLFLLVFQFFAPSIFQQYIYPIFSFPSYPADIIYRPWTIITYMFTHLEFGHLFWNMVMLYFVGKLFLNYTNPRKLLSIYLVGGIASALFFALLTTSYEWFKPTLIGASGSIMALFAYTVIYNPQQKVMLFGVFPIKIMYLGLIFLASDLMQISAGNNVGGHIAHLGGAAYGWFSVTQHKKHKNPERWIESILDKLFASDFRFPSFNFSKKAKMKAKYYGAKEKTKSSNQDTDYNAAKNVKQEVIDAILDKIAKSGYESLSKEEKAILFDASKN